MENRLVKIRFNLTKDSDNYPPADAEWLWAREEERGVFKIDNIPFFAKKVSVGDVVEADLDVCGEYIYKKHRSYSGHGTIRILFERESDIPEVREKIIILGGSSELSHVPTLISVDIPADSNVTELKNFLYSGESRGDWEVEEASIWW